MTVMYNLLDLGEGGHNLGHNMVIYNPMSHTNLTNPMHAYSTTCTIH